MAIGACLAERRIAFLAPALLFALGMRLQGEILRVPTDYPTIKSAVGRAVDGDTVLVDDGTYLEKNIEVAKKVLIRSKNLFGAVIYGSPSGHDPIFKIRAATRIEGFILRGSSVGIEQRDSPDVRWEAEDLAVIDCGAGLSINDVESNIGSAAIRNVIVIGAGDSGGVTANDAGNISVSNSLFMNCRCALAGYDHLSFRVEDTAVLDCPTPILQETPHRPVPPATSRVETGRNFLILKSSSLKDPGRLGEARAFLGKYVLNRKAEPGDIESDQARDARRSVRALVLAMAMAAAGEHEMAAKSYDAARAAGERAGSQEIVWQALWGSVQNEASRADYTEALRRGRQAADYLERWIRSIPAGIYSANFLEDKKAVFETIIGYLLDRHAKEPLAGYDREAFFFAERAKSLAGLFPSRGGRAPNGMSMGIDGDKAAARGQIAMIQRRLQDPNLAEAEKERFVSLLEKAEDDFHAALVKEERTATAWDAKTRERNAPAFPPLDYPGVRERLDGRGLLSYVLGEKRTFAFLATEKGLRCVDLPPAAEIKTKLEPYLRFLQIEEGRGFLGVKGGTLLYGMLMAPLLTETADLPRRLIIVPDGRLFYLPFEALVRRWGDGGKKDRVYAPDFCAEAAEISYASSATQALVGESWGGTGGRPSSLLAIGNSGSIQCDNRSRKLKHFFAPLAHVRREIRALAGSYPWRKATVLLDEEAGEGRVKTALATENDIVHMAAHGVIDDASWWRSALLLRPDAASGEDGFLTALEIADLKLQARLVVLSGCGTGSGALFQGEGIKGLSGSFLRAGADYVMVSLWNVDDKTTAVFMENFYGFLARGDPPARASARAKQDMIRSGLRNPFYWAPFVLIGRADGGR